MHLFKVQKNACKGASGNADTCYTDVIYLLRVAFPGMKFRLQCRFLTGHIQSVNAQEQFFETAPGVFFLLRSTELIFITVGEHIHYISALQVDGM